MAELYLSMKALDTLYNGFGGIYSKMLTRQKCLYLDLTPKELRELEDYSDSGDEESIIHQLKSDGRMEIVAARSVCDKVKSGTFDTSDCGASPVFILELNHNVPTDIRDTYGVLCISDSDITRGSLAPLIESTTKYLIKPKDRRNEQIDDNKGEIVSWSSILKKSNQTCNAIVINDHYLFKNDGYKFDKSTPDNELKNLKEIIDSLLPQKQKEGNVQILLLCEKDDLGNINRRATFIKKSISKLRPSYPITFEIISGNNDCPEFEYTHNRQVATNYAIINVDHVLAAFDINGKPTHDQPVRYMPLYSDGLWNDSDFPEKNQEAFLERLYHINETTNNYAEGKSSGYEYFQNGKVMNIHCIKVLNRLISQFFGLRDGDNCSYLSVPNKSNWQELKTKSGVYTRIGYKDCIVVPSKDEYRLKNVIPQIVDVFKHSPSVEGTNRDNKQDYYWVACTTASDIKTIHVLSPDQGEKAPNYYQFNCYQTKQDAEVVVNKVITILKDNNLW